MRKFKLPRSLLILYHKKETEKSLIRPAPSIYTKRHLLPLLLRLTLPFPSNSHALRLREALVIGLGIALVEEDSSHSLILFFRIDMVGFWLGVGGWRKVGFVGCFVEVSRFGRCVVFFQGLWVG
jgi:hypothetical protein